MRITWHSHSCFTFEDDQFVLLFDPYLSGNALARIRSSDVRCTHVFCTHAHEDHVGDALEIAQRNDARIFAPFELAEHLAANGAKTVDLMPGGGIKTDFGHVKMIPAVHSSAREPGEGKNLAMGIPAGFLVRLGESTFYHAGDTALFSDMRLLGEMDVACLPIGDFYTMGIDDAVTALDYLCPKLALPMHYNTNEKIRADPQEFARKAAAAGHRVRVLAVEESIEI